MKKTGNVLPPIATATADDVKLVKMMAEGMTGKQMAAKLGINHNTLAFNLSVLRSKFGVKNSMALLSYFYENGIISQTK